LESNGKLCELSLQTVSRSLSRCEDNMLAPSGVGAPVRPLQEVRKLAEQAKGESACIFGGTIAQLTLTGLALDNGMDTGRISHCLAQIGSPDALKEVLGTMQVNSSLWSSEQIGDFRRCHKDAEVAAVVLAIYWHREDENLVDIMLKSLSDLVFDARAYGMSLDFKLEKFSLSQKEEDQRDVLGMSAARKCLTLVDLAGDLVQEGRHAHLKNESDKLEALFKNSRSASFLENWSAETMRRFLQVGRRLSAEPKIIELVQRWEMLDKRYTFIDNMATLRAVMGCATTSEDGVCSVVWWIFVLQPN
jgi:hypothetical protein